MNHYKTIKSLGTPHVIYQGLIDFLDDLELAVMLAHLLYWSDKTDNPLGIYRSNDEWYQLFRFKERKVKQLSDELERRGLITKTYKRLEHRVYYLFNIDVFNAQFEQFANGGFIYSPTVKNDVSRTAEMAIGGQQKQRLADSENGGSFIQRLHTKITTEKHNNTRDEILTAEQAVEKWEREFGFDYHKANETLQFAGIKPITEDAYKRFRYQVIFKNLAQLNANTLRYEQLPWKFINFGHNAKAEDFAKPQMPIAERIQGKELDWNVL